MRRETGNGNLMMTYNSRGESRGMEQSSESSAAVVGMGRVQEQTSTSRPAGRDADHVDPRMEDAMVFRVYSDGKVPKR